MAAVPSRVYNRKEGEYPTHYSTVYHPFTGGGGGGGSVTLVVLFIICGFTLHR